jgi:hypothetical protein
VRDDLRLAYATLGLPQGASLREIKARRKALVRQWHPDRFQNDPVGQAEATQRLRAINDAYQTVRAALPHERVPPPAPHASPEPKGPAPRPATTRFSFATLFPPRRSQWPPEDTRLDRVLRFVLGATLGVVVARRVVVLWSPANDLLAWALLTMIGVLAGVVAALFGNRFLDWLAEPRP